MPTTKRFFVYVIRLDRAVLQKKKFANDNLDYIAGMNCFYVGMTGKTPMERYDQHKTGYKACRFVTEFGIELMPQTYGCINPRSYVEAMRLERKVAARLKRRGFAVWQR